MLSPEDDKHPSTIKLEKPLSRVHWGPIVPMQGTKKWGGGMTPGKTQVLYSAID